MTDKTPNRQYPLPDDDAVLQQSGTEAFYKLIGAVTAIDFDIHGLFTAMAQKSAVGHHHAISDVEGLQGQLDEKMLASRQFKVDDLTDVDGADAAPPGYVLGKTPTGWVAMSALAAVGNHQHTIEQIDGLTIELGKLQPLNAKGTANGYAALDADGKVPPGNLPALTTTATVGAAIAGANGKSAPDDGDRFSGVLAGGSTVFWTTWGNIKTAINALISAATGGNMAGRAFPRKSDGSAMNVQWAGQGGQPSYLVGSNDGTNFPVWNPSNFSVNYAASAGTANNVGGWTQATISAQIESRAAAYADDRMNRAFTSSQMAGFTSQGFILTSGASQSFDNSAYVLTSFSKSSANTISVGSRQPQLHRNAYGWTAAFPW